MRPLLGIILCSFLLAGCAQNSVSRREPGEKLLLDSEATWKRYQCNNKKLPLAVIEQNEIKPLKLNPNGEFNHYFVYVMCPSKAIKTIRATLYRKIYFKDNVVFQDATADFELKPGKWGVDAFVRVPPQVEPGTYFFKLVIASSMITIERNLYFIVEE